jgi:hypothetical protein
MLTDRNLRTLALSLKSSGLTRWTTLKISPTTGQQHETDDGHGQRNDTLHQPHAPLASGIQLT